MNITIHSNSYDLVMLSDETVLPFKSLEVNLESLDARELKSLRYLHQVGRVLMTEADRGTLNRYLYKALDLSVGTSEVDSGSSVSSVNGQTGEVQISTASLGAVKTTDLASEVLKVYPGLNTVVANTNTNTTNIGKALMKTDLASEIAKVHPNLNLAVQFTDTGKKTITLNTTKVTGVAEGTISASSTDAVNGAQLNTVSTTLNSTITTQVSSLNTTINTKADKSAVASTDVIKEGTTNLYFTTPRLLSSKITVTDGTNTAIANGDTIAIALAKLQAQITALKAEEPAA